MNGGNDKRRPQALPRLPPPATPTVLGHSGAACVYRPRYGVFQKHCRAHTGCCPVPPAAAGARLRGLGHEHTDGGNAEAHAGHCGSSFIGGRLRRAQTEGQQSDRRADRSAPRHPVNRRSSAHLGPLRISVVSWVDLSTHLFVYMFITIVSHALLLFYQIPGAQLCPPVAGHVGGHGPLPSPHVPAGPSTMQQSPAGACKQHVW